jgi:hypothetical protein
MAQQNCCTKRRTDCELYPPQTLNSELIKEAV